MQLLGIKCPIENHYHRTPTVLYNSLCAITYDDKKVHGPCSEEKSLAERCSPE